MITIHCSDSPNGKAFTAEDIRAWHIARGWKDIGYHGVVCVDGGFQQGRPDDEQGAHVESHNDGNLGVCMVGKDKFSLKQFETLKWWATHKMAAYKIGFEKILGHYEWDTGKAQGKTCPNIPGDVLRFWVLNGDEKVIAAYLL